ncbi:MAG TPA: LapA family protein [bacterium (Candidatus Stahlbacteria)]|nr:LapA family protein [Candidatus Stahlbacteria bacterium]
MRIFTLLFSLVLLILFIIFIILNGGQVVDIRFLGLNYPGMSLSIVVFFTFLIGAFFILVIAVINEIRLRSRLTRAHRENKRLKEELDSLRNLPVDEEEGEEE